MQLKQLNNSSNISWWLLSVHCARLGSLWLIAVIDVVHSSLLHCTMFTVFCFQFSRYDEVFQALDTAITEMKRCARDMRKLSSDHQIRDFGPIYVHYGVLYNACFKYD
jgi:hypothetical protein